MLVTFAGADNRRMDRGRNKREAGGVPLSNFTPTTFANAAATAAGSATPPVRPPMWECRRRSPGASWPHRGQLRATGSPSPTGNPSPSAGRRWRAISSRLGPRCKRSPVTPVLSRPTTTPNAHYEAPSSTASSASAASPRPASSASPACSQPTRPADYSAGRYTPTSPTPSPPTTAATQCPYSPKPGH